MTVLKFLLAVRLRYDLPGAAVSILGFVGEHHNENFPAYLFSFPAEAPLVRTERCVVMDY